jgi:hypothetical protein
MSPQEIARIFDEQMKKLNLLLDHYDIPRDDGDRWLRLSWELACEFLPGMQFTEWQPPKDTWEWRSIILAARVDVLQEQRNRGIRDAIRTLQKRFPEWRRYKPKALEARYYEAKKKSHR